MEHSPEYIKRLGARRKHLKAELAELDAELKAVLPGARGAMTQQAISEACGISLPTVAAWLTR